MRARMALVSAQIQCEVNDIDFKNKPEHLLKISPKGTVPVLETTEGKIIDESLDIVFWSLEKNDSLNFLSDDLRKAKELIQENDGSFKAALDRYKYPNRFPEEDCSNARQQGLIFLKKLNSTLSMQSQLISDNISIADICIFPFVRQFSNVDKEWFDSLDMPYLHEWLKGHLESDLFSSIMMKHDESPYFLI